jgi:hypothetical protein
MDSSSVAKITASDYTVPWSPVAGTEYEIEVNYDFTGGATRIFIDGVQHDATVTTTFTRSAGDALYLVLGSYSGGNSFPADCSYDDVAVFNAVKHTAPFPSELPHTYGEQTQLLLDLQDSAGNSVMTVDPKGVISVGGFVFDELTGNTVPYITLDKQVASSSVTNIEIDYVHGVTSSIQSQLNGKQNTITPANLTTSTSGVTVSGTGATLAAATVDIQTATTAQPGLLSAADWTTFNGKQAALGFTPENSANKGTASGYASLDASGLVPVTQR